MSNTLIQALLLIVQSLASFFSILLLLRFFMQCFRVSFANPIGAFVVQLTNWLVLPLRRVIPAAFGYDLPSLFGVYLLQALSLLFSVLLLSPGLGDGLPDGVVGFVLLRSLLTVLRLTVYLFIGLLIAQAVLSWVNPRSPLAWPIRQMTDPLLRPLRRFVPPVGAFDLTPLVAILIAQVVLLFL